MDAATSVGGCCSTQQADRLTDAVAAAEGAAPLDALRNGVAELRLFAPPEQHEEGGTGDDSDGGEGCGAEGCDGGLMRDDDESAAALRFEVGDGVACQMCPGDWRTGEVVGRRYREPGMPAGLCAAYQVRLDESGGKVFAPRDISELIVAAPARMGGRQSLLHALSEYCGGDLLAVVCEQLPLTALERLSRATSWLRPFACHLFDSAAWLRSPAGRAGVVELARRLPCRGTSDSDIPRCWRTVRHGTMPRDTLCWGWRTNLEQAVKRGDAAMVRLIASNGNSRAATVAVASGGGGRGALGRRSCANSPRFTYSRSARGCSSAPQCAATWRWRVCCSTRWAPASTEMGCARRTSPQSGRPSPRAAATRGRPSCSAAATRSARPSSPSMMRSTSRRVRGSTVGELLLWRGADPNVLGGTMSVSPLSMAAINQNLRLARRMLARGGDPRKPIGDGNTPLDLTRAQLVEGDESIAEMVSLLEGTAPPLLGRRVRLHGLSRAELNGKTGCAQRFASERGRYAVALEGGGETMLIKPANLEPVDDVH